MDQAVQVCVSRVYFPPNTDFFVQSIIVRTQGGSSSLKVELIGELLRQNKGFLELRRLEAARDMATILSQSQNKVIRNSQRLLLNVFSFFLSGNTNDLRSKLFFL